MYRRFEHYLTGAIVVAHNNHLQSSPFTLLLALGIIATPYQVAAQTTADPSAAAQALIDAQKANAAFRALANPNARLVLHIQSGMPCLIANGTEGVLTLYKPDGTDVGCEQKQSNGANIAMFAMYLPDTKLEDMISSQIKSALRWRWTSPPQNLSPVNATPEPNLPFNVGRVGMVGEIDGVRSMVRLSATKTPDGWIITQRFIAPVSVGGADESKSISMGFGGADMVMNETVKFMANERSAKAAPSH